MSYQFPTSVDLRGRAAATGLTIGYRLAGTATSGTVAQSWVAAFTEVSTQLGLFVPSSPTGTITLPSGFSGSIFYGTNPGSGGPFVDVALDQIGPGSYENASYITLAYGSETIVATLAPDGMDAVVLPNSDPIAVAVDGTSITFSTTDPSAATPLPGTRVQITGATTGAGQTGTIAMGDVGSARKMLVIPTGATVAWSGGIIPTGVVQYHTLPADDKAGYALSSAAQAALIAGIGSAVTNTVGSNVLAIKGVTDQLGTMTTVGLNNSFAFTAASLANASSGGSMTLGSNAPSGWLNAAAFAPDALAGQHVLLGPTGLDSVAIEEGVNARQAFSPILAAVAGAVSGAGTGVVVIKGGNSSTTRITATTDNAGNRSSVVLTLPT